MKFVKENGKFLWALICFSLWAIQVLSEQSGLQKNSKVITCLIINNHKKMILLLKKNIVGHDIGTLWQYLTPCHSNVVRLCGKLQRIKEHKFKLNKFIYLK